MMAEKKLAGEERRRAVTAKGCLILWLTVCFSLCGPFVFPAYASGIRGVKVRIRVEEFDEYGDPVLEAEAGGRGYEVESVAIVSGSPARGPAAPQEGEEKSESGDGKKREEEGNTAGNEDDEAGPGAPLYVCEIRLAADEKEYFAAMEQKDIKLTGVGSVCTRAVRKDWGSVLELTVKLTGLGEVLGKIEKADLSPQGSAAWEKAENAVFYMVQLYRGGSRIGRSHRTEGRVYDFCPLMTEEGDYYYTVRPFSGGGKKGELQQSQVVRLSGQYASENREKCPPSPSGWQREDGTRARYRYSDGLYPQSTWIETEGGRYFFDSGGHVDEQAGKNAA